jgi:hypothetical protein
MQRPKVGTYRAVKRAGVEAIQRPVSFAVIGTARVRTGDEEPLYHTEALASVRREIRPTASCHASAEQSQWC